MAQECGPHHLWAVLQPCSRQRLCHLASWESSSQWKLWIKEEGPDEGGRTRCLQTPPCDTVSGPGSLAGISLQLSTPGLPLGTSLLYL